MDTPDPEFFRLQSLIDSDPIQAVAEARSIATSKPNVAASILIDAAVELNDRECLQEGIAIMEDLYQQHSDSGSIICSLANGYGARVDTIQYDGPGWYMTTKNDRMSSCKLYRQVPASDTDSDLSSRAMANLGNRLLRAFRFVEAYDYYMQSLSYDSTNDVALTGAARILLYHTPHRIGSSDVLQAVAAKHLRKVNIERLRLLAGRKAADEWRPIVETHSHGGELPDLTKANDYELFVAKHRLALVPTIEGLDLNMHRWDSLHIDSYTDVIGDDDRIPELFAMFNVLKSEYLAARQLAFLALNNSLVETGNYIDTLDYSLYGVNQAALVTAQRTALDLLDKTAVACASYLGLPDKVTAINFRKLWFIEEKGNVTNWRDEILAEINCRNTAVIALSELALDVRSDGFLYPTQDRRNTSTHRFTVLYDMGIEAKGTPYLDRVPASGLGKQLIETLQIVRSALFYFVEMVRQREGYKLPKGARIVRIPAPDHDFIRGRDSSESH